MERLLISIPARRGRLIQIKTEVFEHDKAKSQVGEVRGGPRSQRGEQGRTPGVS